MATGGGNGNEAAAWRRQQAQLTALQGAVDRHEAELRQLRSQLASLRGGSAALPDTRQKVGHDQTPVQPAPRHRSLLERLPGGRTLRRMAEAVVLSLCLRRSLFDAAHYRQAVPHAPRHRLPALLHFLLIGRLRGVGPNPLFDPAYYLRRYPDVAAAGADPLLHYLRFGAAEGRKPSALFDGDHYLRCNPDVAAARANPLRHYLAHGWHEHRDPNPFFDTSYYLADGDVRGEPLAHYLGYGAREGRRPSPLFDGQNYLASNPDIAALGVNPLAHYLDYGRTEGRRLVEARLDALVKDRAGTRILLVLHGLGGGVERHCRDLEALLAAEEFDVWRLESIAEGSYRLANRRRKIERGYRDQAGLLADLRFLRLDLVHVHHDIGFGRDLWRWLADLRLPYDITVHDYRFACPRVTLLDGHHRYCAAEQGGDACDRCVAAAGVHPHLQSAFDATAGIVGWRMRSALILGGARRVYVPDRDAADRLRGIFPRIVFRVLPHPEPLVAIPARPPAGGKRVRIAVIGNIGPHKGFDVLSACARAAERDGLNLTFAVLGQVCAPKTLDGLKTVEVLGPYRHEDLPGLLDRAACHVTALFSVVPETFAYTLSDALRAGLYPVVFDIGAPARRLRELGWGTILPLGLAPQDLNRRLMDIAISHPVPTSDLVVGHVYGSMRADYYGLGERTG
jgi:glycosyltransferase involved in cell wall biosynthesis